MVFNLVQAFLLFVLKTVTVSVVASDGNISILSVSGPELFAALLLVCHPASASLAVLLTRAAFSPPLAVLEGGYRILQHLQQQQQPSSWQHGGGGGEGRGEGREGGLILTSPASFTLLLLLPAPLPPSSSCCRHLQSDQITHYYCILSSDYCYSVQWPG